MVLDVSLCLRCVTVIPVMCNQCVSTLLSAQELFEAIISAKMLFSVDLSVIGIDLCVINMQTVLPVRHMTEQIWLWIVCVCVW